MCEKTCSDCKKASRLEKTYVEEHTVQLLVDNEVVSSSTESKVSEPKIILTRNCSQGGTTVPGFDKCISKLEFEPKK